MMAGQPDTVTAHVDALETIVVLLLARAMTDAEIQERLERLQIFINADQVDRYRGDIEERYDQLYQVRALEQLFLRALRKRRAGDAGAEAISTLATLLG